MYKKILALPVEDLGLAEVSLDAYKRLMRFCGERNIKTVGELVNRPEEEVMRSPGIGFSTMYDINEALGLYGLSWNHHSKGLDD